VVLTVFWKKAKKVNSPYGFDIQESAGKLYHPDNTWKKLFLPIEPVPKPCWFFHWLWSFSVLNPYMIRI
jgi:hypothetical protein